ncbi:MAG: DUF4235 domain-containing protein [Actinobacteria bacterium]|nr:DUF4235 domain-containing protein [Actinomycetota bacterium]
MANPAGTAAFKLISLAVRIPVGIATRKAVEKVWLGIRPGDPSHDPRDPDASWGDAIGWALVSALGVAVAELVTTKGASEVWRTVVGTEPPSKREPRAA